MLTIRIDKTAKSGTLCKNRCCNLACIWCHSDYFEHYGFIAITNEKLIAALNRVITASSVSEVQVRLSGGGEPTLAGLEELSDLIIGIKKIPQVSCVKLTTNGILLGKYVKELRESGLDSVTISLNSLNQDGYLKYSQRNELEAVLHSLNIAYSVGLQLKINAIYWSGNADELREYEKLSCKYAGLHIKFFDLIPSNENDRLLYLPLSDLERQIQIWGAEYIEESKPYYQRVYSLPSGAVFIVKKSSEINTCPNNQCQFREICLEGCRHSIRIGLDGVLKPCGVRKDNELYLFQNEINDKEVWQALHSGGKVGY